MPIVRQTMEIYAGKALLLPPIAFISSMFFSKQENVQEHRFPAKCNKQPCFLISRCDSYMPS